MPMGMVLRPAPHDATEQVEHVVLGLFRGGNRKARIGTLGHAEVRRTLFGLPGLDGERLHHHLVGPFGHAQDDALAFGALGAGEHLVEARELDGHRDRDGDHGVDHPAAAREDRHAAEALARIVAAEELAHVADLLPAGRDHPTRPGDDEEVEAAELHEGLVLEDGLHDDEDEEEPERRAHPHARGAGAAVFAERVPVARLKQGAEDRREEERENAGGGRIVEGGAARCPGLVLGHGRRTGNGLFSEAGSEVENCTRKRVALR